MQIADSFCHHKQNLRMLYALIESSSIMSTIRLLIRPAIFTAGVCGTCFCGSAIVNYERTHFSVPAAAIQDWVAAQKLMASKKYLASRNYINRWTNELTTGQRIAGVTIFINFLVLSAWRVNSFRPVLTKYFLSHVSSTKIRLSPMILSCFSHTMPLHFAVNMYALYSFSDISTMQLGPEQLIGLYLSAGAVSSFASVANRLFTKSLTPSLGASGALLGVVAYVGVSRPQLDVHLMFIPVTAAMAIKSLLVFDAVGLIAKWKVIDHAAHLGGTLFGVWYALYGEKLYYRYRRIVVVKYLGIKNRFQ